MESIPYQPTEVDPTYADQSTIVWRPFLPVVIYGTTSRFKTQALVDTGAMETLIPLEIWDEVNPAFVHGEVGQLEAANGSPILVKYGTVDLAVRVNGKIQRWSSKVAFSSQREEMVLGDVGFLRFFAVSCNRANRTLQIWRSAILPPPLMTMISNGQIDRPYRRVLEAQKSRRKKRGRR